MIKVSVIVPVYNMEKYVGECLDSILSQTLTDIEVIAINDGSKDNSLNILYEYQIRDNRIRIIDKENAGVGAARNDGIRAATGKYIAFVDPDDMLDNSNVLYECYEMAEEKNIPVVGGRLVYLYQDGSTEVEKKVTVGDVCIDVIGELQYRDYQYDYGFYCYLYKRDLILKNEIMFPLYSRFQDPPFFVNAMVAAQKIYIMNAPVYRYRQLSGVGKYTSVKTIDFLQGIMDNLRISRQNNLARLHYITAVRLDKEGSYMISKNVGDSRRAEIIRMLMKASSMVDVTWLRSEGYNISEDYYPEVLDYVFSTTVRYERMRKNSCMRILLGVFNRIMK